MIQRIQTVFLFLSSLAALAPFGLPFASGDVTAEGVFADGLYNVMDQIGLQVGLGLAAALALVALFLFRNRRLQMLLALVAALVLLLVIAFGVYVGLQATEAAGPVDIKLGIAFPPLAFVLALLARRAIRKDEQLVRSMDRLR